MYISVMPALPLVSRTCVVFILFVASLVSCQSVPGASFFLGNGAPGAGSYYLVDEYGGSSGFFDKFNFYSDYDPTYGHVQYVNETVAVQNGYATTSSYGTALISVDTTNKWPNGGKGRPSVRLTSNNAYTHGLFILDLVHMPFGCGTWPAYWLLGPNWPYNGEIDIIEGVNTIGWDSVTLHTSANCLVSGSGQTGVFQTNNCNGGCGSIFNSTVTPNNYGAGLNSIGGGVYATEWTSDYIRTWFFPRSAIPASISNGAPNPSADFGEPAVNQQGSCQIDQHFNNMSIIINTDFCGAWAGQVYMGSYPNCPQNYSETGPNASLNSCVDFVGNNPSNFTNAYWEINSIRVYQMAIGAKPTSSYTTSLSSVTPLASTQTIPKAMGSTGSTVSSAIYTGPLSSVSSKTSSSVGSSLSSSTKMSSSAISMGSSLAGYSNHSSSFFKSGSSTISSVLPSSSTTSMSSGSSGQPLSPPSSSYAPSGPSSNHPSSSSGSSGQSSSATSSSSILPASSMAPGTTTQSSTALPSTLRQPLSSSGSSLTSHPSSGGSSPGSWSTILFTTQSSSQTSQMSSSPAPPCPSTVSALCTTANASTTCASASGDTYNMTCGIVYEGTIIQPTGSKMIKRTTESSIQACQALCQHTPGCVALNYQGTDCVLLSHVNGTSYSPGAVAGSIVQTASSTSAIPIAAGATVTVTPIYGFTLTVPAGGSYTSGPSGSYYVYTTSPPQSLAVGSSSCGNSVYLCYTCALTPTVVTGCPGTANTAGTGNSATSGNETMASSTLASNMGATTSTMARSSAGVTAATRGTTRNPQCSPVSKTATTTLFTTHTITSCGTPLICPAFGYTFGGNTTVSTISSSGTQVIYTQVPSSTSRSAVSASATIPPYTVLNCPSSNQKIFSSPMGKQYEIFCNARGSGNTVESQNQTSLVSCIAACDRLNTLNYMIASPCRAITYYPDQRANNCLLNAEFAVVDDTSADSAYLLDPYAGPPPASKTTTTTSVSSSSLPISTTRPAIIAPERLITITNTEISTLETTVATTVATTVHTTEISTVYQRITLPGGTVTLTPASVTITATVVSVSISISDVIITETVTAQGRTVTATATATAYRIPSSSSKPFSCRTLATNYLNGSHGKARRGDRGSIFDSGSFLLFEEMGRSPRPGTVPRL